MPYMRTVKTTSGETAMQTVWSWRRGSREIEHHGSAHNEAELGALKAAAQQRMAAGQLELGLGQRGPRPSGPLPVTSSRMSHLADALEHGYRVPEIERRYRNTTDIRITKIRLAFYYDTADVPRANRTSLGGSL